ncbi:DUF6204 family protein [Kribbella solani]|uniref:Uncharacterized protein n=1 Tax=Kribbella solani TaxID=236067 RepID=A0A841DZM3_9ACTN|nr:DUF6204 family protein [Kribbella solani]MBB5982236.1 hypothetical protein [Kribbella solani]
MNSVRTFRVIVRGEFTGLTADQRDQLRAEIAQHDLLLATYSEAGDLSYDESLRPFTIRCQVVQPADRPDQDAIDHGLLTAGDLLDQRGLPHHRLRATATCLEDIKIPHRKRTGKISTT